MRSEHETILTIGDQDRSEGFFRFGTSKADHFNKVCKRIGGRSKLIALKENTDSQGKTVWYDCWVPVKYLSKHTFGIRTETALKNSEARSARVREANPFNKG